MTEFKSRQEREAPPLVIKKGVEREVLDANQRVFAAKKLVKKEARRRRQVITDSAKGVRNELQAHLNRLGELKNTDSLLTPKPESSLIERHPEEPSLLTKKLIK